MIMYGICPPNMTIALYEASVVVLSNPLVNGRICIVQWFFDILKKKSFCLVPIRKLYKKLEDFTCLYRQQTDLPIRLGKNFISKMI